MRPFLRDIAQSIIDSYGESMSEHCIVFPNNRSILFFRKYLSELISKPVFIPSLKTISDLLTEKSHLKKGEPVQLVFELYQSFIHSGYKRDTLDEFYYLGEMILNDFSDIDKYLVDAHSLFSNLADLKDIDRKFGGIDDEIIEIIKQFWINFDASNMTAEKTDFLTLWDMLPGIYDDYKARLKNKGIAYEGMILRQQSEIIENEKTAWCNDIAMFHFVGFNALNKCERKILKELQAQGRAKFYWDYSPEYIKETKHEAGFFIRQNLSEFTEDNRNSDTNTADCLIKVYSCPSDVSQAKLLPSIINKSYISDDPNELAVILADENLLSPVLNSLPAAVDSVNVTMGYPLYHTPVYSLIHQLLKLQKNKTGSGSNTGFYYYDVINILQHQYIAFSFPDDSYSVISRIKENNIIRVKRSEIPVNELFEMIFTDDFNTSDYLTSIIRFLMTMMDRNEDNEVEKSSRLNLQQEYLYSLLLPVNQLVSVMEEAGIKPGIELYTRLVDRIMRTVNIPFSGEPLEGTQIMGILETRALDFRNIILLSANEGKIPKSPPGNSYIPYNIREAFGLPTIKHSDSIYAYYFYRLLQRAENVKFIYNSSTEGMRSGEMSRFLLQLKYNERYNTEFIDSRFNILPPAKPADIIVHSKETENILYDLFASGSDDKYLSPSAINTWITCNMRFYYKYIAGIKEADEMLEEVDSVVFGNILHQIMKDIYGRYTKATVEEVMIDEMLKKDDLRIIIENCFRSEFMKNSNAAISGKNLVITNILERITRQILNIDKGFAPFEIISLEKKYEALIKLPGSNKQLEVKIGGTIDRVDNLGGKYRVLDYKSGADSIEIGSFEQLFDYDTSSRNSAAFQTLVYCELLYQSVDNQELRPSLYPVRNIFNERFSDTFIIKKGEMKGEIDSYNDIRTEFLDKLSDTIYHIFDTGRDIKMTANRKSCRYCPYSSLCNR